MDKIEIRLLIIIGNFGLFFRVGKVRSSACVNEKYGNRYWIWGERGRKRIDIESGDPLLTNSDIEEEIITVYRYDNWYYIISLYIIIYYYYITLYIYTKQIISNNRPNIYFFFEYLRIYLEHVLGGCRAIKRCKQDKKNTYTQWSVSPKPLHCFGPSWLPTGHVRDVRRLWRASPSSSEKLSKISHCSLRSSGCQWSYLDLEAKHQVMCPWQWTYQDCVGPSSQAKQLWRKVQMSRRTACKWENSSAVNFRKSTMSFRLIRAWEQDKWSSLTSRFVFTLPNLLSKYCKSVPNAWKNRLYVFVNGYIMRSKQIQTVFRPM